MVGYNIGEAVGGSCRRPDGGQPLSWGHLPNGGTVANLGNYKRWLYGPIFMYLPWFSEVMIYLDVHLDIIHVFRILAKDICRNCDRKI